MERKSVLCPYSVRAERALACGGAWWKVGMAFEWRPVPRPYFLPAERARPCSSLVVGGLQTITCIHSGQHLALTFSVT